ncbi:MAG: hypothetical protein HC923_02950 [Myxococcales bacterium]|nr:hypothetical protein [Myxococcales bacterium]
MSELQDWKITAASNNAAPPDGWPETLLAPSAINNIAREMMAVVARWYRDNNGSIVATGSAGAYAITSNRVFAGNLYAVGQEFCFETNHARAGLNATLAVTGANAVALSQPSASSARPLRLPDGSNAILANGALVRVIYDGTVFQIIGGHVPASFAREVVTVATNTTINSTLAGKILYVTEPNLVFTVDGSLDPGETVSWICPGISPANSPNVVNDTGGSVITDSSGFSINDGATIFSAGQAVTLSVLSSAQMFLGTFRV